MPFSEATWDREHQVSRDREARRCDREGCGHKFVTHGSFNPVGQFVGLGLGACGGTVGHDDCACDGFLVVTLAAL